MKTDLIVALDVESLQKAKDIVEKLYPVVKYFKVGSQLFTACGPEIVQSIGKAGGKVFLDLKFYDIPNTVRNVVATSTATSIVFETTVGSPEIQTQAGESVKYPIFMMTVHAVGGQEMMRWAAEAARERAAQLSIERPKIVGVTVLTSTNADSNTQETVLALAREAQISGLDGVVCSVHEAAAVRKACGENFIIVTPGIRLSDGAAGDQKRIATPAAAVAAGSNYLVVGRPILEASDPLKVAKKILEEISN